jgi:hypothetical protein
VERDGHRLSTARHASTVTLPRSRVPEGPRKDADGTDLDDVVPRRRMSDQSPDGTTDTEAS